MSVSSNTPRAKRVSKKDEEIATLKAQLKAMEGNQSEGDDSGKIQLDELIPVMSLLPYPLILSTQERGQGRIKKFARFGQLENVFYQDLMMVMDAHRNFLEWGYFIILDKRVIKRHGLQEIYAKILTKEKIEEILSGSKNCVELYKSCNEEQQREIVGMLVDKLRDDPQSIDLNVVDKLSRLSGVNISEKAEDAREYTRAREEASAEK